MEVDDFQSHLNQSFKISFTDQDLELKLTEVEQVGKPYKEGARQPFTVTFVADATEGVLQQGVYSVENEAMGKKDIFLIPREVEDSKCRYDAMYN